MRILFSILLFVICFSCLAQVDKGCLSLDFERIPFDNPESGLEISDQYLDQFGISFRLEGGGFPVLAEVGGTTEAFGSMWGNDVPAPGVDIGRFFLTDDGVLSGLIAQPVVLEFETPIDSFAGCILDMDFGEKFIIHALDADDNIILADTIVDGDPNTGDGALTCWGFNLPGCIGTISTIRFAGERQQSGAFGLGLDHFSFCYSGLDILVDRKPETCSELGTITVESGNSEDYEFSLDGIEYFDTGVFTDLEAGPYIVFVRNDQGCETEVVINLAKDVPAISNIIIEPTLCGLDNGSIEIEVTNGNAEWYSLDGLDLQENNFFDNLSPGDYFLTIETDKGCVLSENITILPSTAPILSLVASIDDECQESIGFIEVEGTGDGLDYSIDGIEYQSSPRFENLTAGLFQIYLKDENDCLDSMSLELETTPQVLLAEVDISPAICDEVNGIISIDAEGGAGSFIYSIDSLSTQESGLFENLSGGSYTVLVTDENFCSATRDVVVPEPAVVRIDSVVNIPTSCGLENGQLIIESSFSEGVQYSVNGAAYNSEFSYNELQDGTYTISIVDENGCESNTEAIVDPSEGVIINAVESTEDQCQKSNGTITVSAQSANGLVDYSLDDESYQADSLFSGLMSGLHFVSARDVLGCEAVANVMIDSTPIISFINIDVTEPECFSNSGIIDIDLGGGTGELNYFIDGEVLNNLQITNLAPANYEILVTDSLGCASSAAVEVPIPLCPIYFPNIITPHLSNPNNLFIASTHELYDVGIIEYSIFDRWGEKIFVSRDFSIHTRGSVWWDGRINGKMAEQDVYAYRVEVVHPNGQVEVFIDTVFLLR